MKKNLLQVIAVFYCTNILAQPTLNSSGLNPVLGETLKIKSGNYVSPGNSGANQTWNLSGINSSATTNYTVGTVSSTPYSSTFSSSSNIQKNDGSTYAFMNNSSSVMSFAGVVGGGVTIPYSNTEEIMHFPFNMNDTYNDTWAATFTSNSITFNRTGTTTVTYDGYGTLTTPAGTFSNVARIHLVQDYKDVSSFPTITYHNDEYIWYANGFHEGLASVFTLTNSLGGSATQVGTYLDATPGLPTFINEWNMNASVSSYPNPATNVVYFTSDTPISGIELYDLKGELVLSEKVNSMLDTGISVEDMNSGIYLAKINTINGTVVTKKITLNK
jgi:hypothetical protein